MEALNIFSILMLTFCIIHFNASKTRPQSSTYSIDKLTDLEIIDFLGLAFLLRWTRSGRLVIDHSAESFDVVVKSDTQFFISRTNMSEVVLQRICNRLDINLCQLCEIITDHVRSTR